MDLDKLIASENPSKEQLQMKENYKISQRTFKNDELIFNINSEAINVQ